jgi:hypothetical protein
VTPGRVTEIARRLPVDLVDGGAEGVPVGDEEAARLGRHRREALLEDPVHLEVGEGRGESFGRVGLGREPARVDRVNRDARAIGLRDDLGDLGQDRAVELVETRSE